MEAPAMTSTAVPTPQSWEGVRSAIELFILERRAERRQPKTISDYRLHLGQFYSLFTAYTTAAVQLSYAGVALVTLSGSWAQERISSAQLVRGVS
jgi:hypothetical protein